MAGADNPLPDGVTQEDADAALADAITDRRRWPRAGVRIDWAQGGTFDHVLSRLADPDPDAKPGQFSLESLTITRELATDLPEEVGIVDGAAEGTAEAVLGPHRDPDTGEIDPEANDPVRAFAPWNPDAPLYGYPLIRSEVRLDTGFETPVGTLTSRRFTGAVSSIKPDPDPDERTVTVGAFDGANRMHAPITLPAVGMDGIFAATYGLDRYNSLTNSQWLVDLICRANGIYASPPPQPGTFLSATMHGSSFPELGGGGVPRQGSLVTPSNPDCWSNEGHPFGMLYPRVDAPRPAGRWTCDEVLTMQPGDGFGVSFWALMPPVASASLMQIIMNGSPAQKTTDAFAVLVDIAAATPRAIVFTPGTLGISYTPALYKPPAVPTWRHVGVHWGFRDPPTSAAPATNTNIPVSCEMTIHVDGVDYGSLIQTIDIGPIAQNKWAPSTTVGYFLETPVTNICWFRAPVCPGPGEWVADRHVSQADIDPGLNQWTGIRQVNGEDSWSLLTEVAAAESATIGFGVDDRFFFRSRARRHVPEVAEPVTSDRDLADLTVTTDEAGVRNSISAAIQPVLVGDYEWVVDAKDPAQFDCGPGANLFNIALPADTVLVEPWAAYQMNRAAWEVYADHPYFRSTFMFCAVYLAMQTTNIPGKLINILLFPQSPGHMVLAVFNNSGHDVRFMTETRAPTSSGSDPDYGSAAFRLPGRLLKESAVQPYNVQDPGSVSIFGPRTYDLGGGQNRWLQHPRAIQGVAEAILTQTAHPVPVLDAVTSLHDPRRDLGQRITIADPEGLGSVRGTITGITTTLGVGDPALDALTVRPLKPPGFGLLDDDIDGRVGETLVFGP